jgi:hypothetical protein
MGWIHASRWHSGLVVVAALLAGSALAQAPAKEKAVPPNPYAGGYNPNLVPGPPAPPRRDDDPPLTEIWSGKALNERLEMLQDLYKRKVIVPRVVLEKKVAEKINITRGTSRATIALFKNEGRIAWPKSLSGSEYKADQERIASQVAAVIAQARKGRVDARILEDMTRAKEAMKKTLTDQVGDVPPSQYIEARRFLYVLENALETLRQPEVAELFKLTAEIPLRCKTVEDLVQFMTEKDLHFAPAVHGDETAYQELHYALTTAVKRERSQPKK